MNRAVFAVAILMAGTTVGQVRIRETVSISPVRAKNVEVASGSLRLFANSAITVTITHGYDDIVDPCNTDLDLVLFSPDHMMIMDDALHNFGRSWTSPEFGAGSILTFGIIEHHACSGLVDTVTVTMMSPSQLSALDSTFSMEVYGRSSRCNITQDPGWSGLFFSVTLNSPLRFDHFEVTATQEVIEHLDSAVVKVVAKDKSNNEIAIPDWMTLEVSVPMHFEGIFWTSYGTLESPQGVKGMYHDVTYGEATQGKVKYLANDYAIDRTLTDRITVRSVGEYYVGAGSLNITIVPPAIKHTILLGETRFYQALPDPNDETKLVFAEMTETSGWISGGQPATFTVTPESPTDKLATYYEFKDKEGDPLAGDIVRLVGRYWEDGKTYKVKLSATSSSRTGSIDIEVKKPSSLGNSDSTASDVHGKGYDLDDSIMTYAGKAGVLPQYIKAIIRNETVGRFAPSYRYEPFLDMQMVQKKDAEGNYAFKPITPYWISSPTDLGKPGIPTDHKNLYNTLGPISGYPGYQTVWDIYNLDMQNQRSLYSLAVYGNTYGLEDHRSFFQRNGLSHGLGYNQASDCANAQFMIWMRDVWNGGMKNTVAQTRVASSYGLLQLVYYYGITDGEYPIDPGHRPEDINLVSYSLYYGILHFVNKLGKSLSVPLNSNGWPGGLGKSYLNGLKLYNPKPDYAPDIVKYCQQYEPQ